MPELKAGQRFGQYRLVKRLGRGGMGEVWRATDIAEDYDGPDIALKILHSVTDETALKREVEGHRRVGQRPNAHPGICELVDFGSVAGTPYIALELLDGADLDQVIEKAGGRLPLDRALPILLDVLDALAHAHERRVFHTDLKPPNVRVLSSGRAKIVDFGIAKLRSLTREITIDIDGRPRSITGTPPYMAPEQWGESKEFGKIDARTDLYAFGVMLFEVLAGETPFRGELGELMLKHADEPPPSLVERVPGLPSSIESVYQRLLAKRKEDRFATAGETRAALIAAAEARTVADMPAQPAPPEREGAAVEARAPSSPAPVDRAPTLPVRPSESPTLPPRASEAPTLPPRPARGPESTIEVPPPAPSRPRLQLRWRSETGERALHVHVGVRAVLGRIREPESADEAWSSVPDFCLRYLPLGDPRTKGTISRRQLEVRIDPGGARVIDLSGSGTLLDERRLAKGEPAPLETGARLRVGPGPLELVATVFAAAAGGAPAAVLLSRRGNAEHHAYLLLAAAAPIGSARGCAIELPASAGVRPVHAYLAPAPATGRADAAGPGLAILPVDDAPVVLDGRALASPVATPIAPGSTLTLGAARAGLEAHLPRSDEALR